MIEAEKDYAEGYYSGSGDRMANAIYPDFRKYALMKMPGFEKSVFIESSYSGLIQRSYEGAGKSEESTWKLMVTPLKVDGEIACARLTSAQFNDCLHLVRVGDGWKIVNVLWAFGPDSRNRNSVPELNNEQEKQVVEQLVNSFFAGLLSGDRKLVGEALSENFTVAKWARTTSDGDPYLSRDARGLLIELAGAKMTVVPEENRQVAVDVLDLLDGMATIRVDGVLGVSYLHACYLNGSWKLVHMIRYQAPRG